MSLIRELEQLDDTLFAEFSDTELLQPAIIEARLAERAQLLQMLVQSASADIEALNAEQTADVIERSRRLMQQAELCRSLLAEKLAVLQKGRRSKQVYGEVKKNNQE